MKAKKRETAKGQHNNYDYDGKNYYYGGNVSIVTLAEIILTVDWWDTLEERIKKEYPNLIDFEFTSVTYYDYNYVVKYSYALNCVNGTLQLKIKDFIINEFAKTIKKEFIVESP